MIINLNGKQQVLAIVIALVILGFFMVHSSNRANAAATTAEPNAAEVEAKTAPTHTPTTPDPRPVPPDVQVFGIPPGSPMLEDMIPAACHTDARCGLACFYDNNTPVEDGRAVSCVPMIFLP